MSCEGGSTTVTLQVWAGVNVMATAFVGGVFLAFSDFLMRSLREIGEPCGSNAMKAINVAVFRYVFIPMFMLMVPSTAALALVAWRAKQRNVVGMLGAAAFVYVVLVFLVTGMGNVPMNNALATLDGDAATSYWRSKYLPRWTALNTLRTVGCALSAACSLVAVARFNGTTARHDDTTSLLRPL